jgi:hypothetical protein
MAKYDKDYIKKRTLEIYDSMPQDKALRMRCLKERDELIEINYSFFGYIATHTFINNSSVTYEDKLQSALLHFCECFWWYKWDGSGDPNHKGYRSDLAFTVFFKPRIGEMIERELNEVKYSIRRSLCMEAGEQLGKHWGQVKYDDLAQVTLPADKMNSLKAIFGSMYWADLDTHAMFIAASSKIPSVLDTLNDRYDSLEDLLIHEMIDVERRLTDADLVQMGDLYCISVEDLRRALPRAEDILYKQLKDHQQIAETFE